jgi:thioredoxin reductase
MTTNYYDIIIIGSGIAGLFSAYNIKKISPNTTFLILEQHKKQWIGGRTSNEMFYGTEIVTGAGVGRKDKDILLIKLMNEIGIKYKQYENTINYSQTFTPVDIGKIIKKLKIEYNKHPELHHKTFKDFFIAILGEKLYKTFIISTGYTDYENADLYETLYNYGMDDNKGGWTGLYIPWKNMVDRLYHIIGKNHFRFSNDVTEIKKINQKPCLFQIKTENGALYNCNRVIVATTITGIQKLVPGASSKSSLYQQIRPQPFLRLYAKFNKESSEIMKKYVTGYTIVPGPLQKIIPMDSNKGVYMIAYSDNTNALLQKKYLDNTLENRNLYCDLIEESLGIPKGQLQITAMQDYYWPVGTHYYEPLKGDFKTRNEFVYKAQHPENGMLVVGEAVSRHQGWTEGALESVKIALDKHWIVNEC